MILLSSAFSSLIQLVGILIIFCFVLVITYLVTRWIGGFQKSQMAGQSLQVLDTVRIAANKYVQILKIGDVYLVIAVGKDEVTMLAKLTAEEIGLAAEELMSTERPSGGLLPPGTQETFQETLEKFRERFSKKQD